MTDSGSVIIVTVVGEGWSTATVTDTAGHTFMRQQMAHPRWWRRWLAIFGYETRVGVWVAQCPPAAPTRITP